MDGSAFPPGERLRRALLWLSEELETRRDELPAHIVEEASIRFDLSPAQEEWLLFILRGRPAPSAGEQR